MYNEDKILKMLDIIAEELQNVKRDMATKAELQELRRDMATKAELQELRRDMATKAELQGLRRDMATKAELQELRRDMATKAELQELRRDMATNAELQEVKSDLHMEIVNFRTEVDTRFNQLEEKLSVNLEVLNERLFAQEGQIKLLKRKVAL